jgi:hypothetical protein
MMVQLGAIYTTPGAHEALEAAGLTADDYVVRHANGDWGDLGTATWANGELKDGFRVFSAYTLPTGAKICIFTEDDRSLTTVHLPEEVHLIGGGVTSEPMHGWARTWRR